jgi:hypothetical protein
MKNRLIHPIMVCVFFFTFYSAHAILGLVWLRLIFFYHLLHRIFGHIYSILNIDYL